MAHASSSTSAVTVETLIAALRSDKSYTASMAILRANPALLNEIGAEGKTPLQVAIERGLVAVTEGFLREPGLTEETITTALVDARAKMAAHPEFNSTKVICTYLESAKVARHPEALEGFMAEAVETGNLEMIIALSKIPGNYELWEKYVTPAYEKLLSLGAHADAVKTPAAREQAKHAEQIYDCFYTKRVIAAALANDADSLQYYQETYGTSYVSPVGETVIHALTREVDHPEVVDILRVYGLLTANIVVATDAAKETALGAALQADRVALAHRLLDLVPAATRSPELTTCLSVAGAKISDVIRTATDAAKIASYRSLQSHREAVIAAQKAGSAGRAITGAPVAEPYIRAASGGASAADTFATATTVRSVASAWLKRTKEAGAGDVAKGAPTAMRHAIAGGAAASAAGAEKPVLRSNSV